jgi:hypothetical protein
MPPKDGTKREAMMTVPSSTIVATLKP